MMNGKTGEENVLDISDSSKSTADRISDELISDISAGLLEPGERLDEVTLARRFSASRTPVREALHRLKAQKILTQSDENGKRRGLRIASYSVDELSQMFEAMEEIEAICAKMASQRLNLMSEAKILRELAKMEEAASRGDRSTFLRSNEAFHTAIYDATQNEYIAELASSFRHRTGPFRAKRYRTKQDMIDSIPPHRALVDTILGRVSPEAGNDIRRKMARDYLINLEAS
jgi:DNA-binding GntR family transcriptional regulator